ncbi:synaptonemal complex central element protein 2-like [Rhopilema esculentum]|uniref:synaptonemal complex central element protein 2-like n=1 Tax=Rhopilema esculentum TaxID=499914 RepID=UPI0031D5F7E2
MDKQHNSESIVAYENDEAPPIPRDKKREQKESTEEQKDIKTKKHKKNSKKPIVSTSSDQLFDQAQSLIAEINDKRKNDSMLLTEFKKTMELLLEKCNSALERSLFQSYSTTGNIMQEKLQDLYTTLDRISTNMNHSHYNQNHQLDYWLRRMFKVLTKESGRH